MLQVTFSNPRIYVDLGVYGNSNSVSKYMVFNGKHIINVRIREDNDEIVDVELSETFLYNKKIWPVTWNSNYSTPENGVMVVQTINGVAPTSAMDLLQKISDMMC